MKLTRSSLAVVCALALGAGACSQASSDSNNGGSGGSGGKGGSGGSSSGTGGSGGSSSGTGGSGGSSAGAGGSSSGTGDAGDTGGSGASAGTGGAGGSAGTGGADTDAGTGGTGGSADDAAATGGASGDAGAPDAAAAGGKMMLTVDFDPTDSTPDHLCFKPEATNSGGNHSPKMDWTTPPAGTKSLVLMMEDQTPPPIPHRIVCNMMPTETGQAADIKMMLPAGAMAGTGHGKAGNPWYGPGTVLRKYEITIFALATPALEGGCGPGKAQAIAARDYLKKNKENKAIVLDWDSKTLWGDSTGTKCK